MKCGCGQPVRDSQCFNCGAWHDNYGFDDWPHMPADEPTTTEAPVAPDRPSMALSGGGVSAQ